MPVGTPAVALAGKQGISVGVAVSVGVGVGVHGKFSPRVSPLPGVWVMAAITVAQASLAGPGVPVTSPRVKGPPSPACMVCRASCNSSGISCGTHSVGVGLAVGVGVQGSGSKTGAPASSYWPVHTISTHSVGVGLGVPVPSSGVGLGVSLVLGLVGLGEGVSVSEGSVEVNVGVVLPSAVAVNVGCNEGGSTAGSLAHSSGSSEGGAPQMEAQVLSISAIAFTGK